MSHLEKIHLDLTDILRIPGGRKARIAPLSVLCDGKSRSGWARGGRNRKVDCAEVGQQPGIEGDRRAAKLHQQSTAEIEPHGALIGFTRRVPHHRPVRFLARELNSNVNRLRSVQNHRFIRGMRGQISQQPYPDPLRRRIKLP